MKRRGFLAAAGMASINAALPGASAAFWPSSAEEVVAYRGRIYFVPEGGEYPFDESVRAHLWRMAYEHDGEIHCRQMTLLRDRTGPITDADRKEIAASYERRWCCCSSNREHLLTVRGWLILGAQLGMGPFVSRATYRDINA